jgi:hypothetical protein
MAFSLNDEVGNDEEVDLREEVDIVRIDPLFLERQRNRYASRAVAFLGRIERRSSIAASC